MEHRLTDIHEEYEPSETIDGVSEDNSINSKPMMRKAPTITDLVEEPVEPHI